MPQSPNTAQLGHYEILAPLGKGGMGEVFRARDTRLNREVALKFLPAEFVQDIERLRRFEQEARAISSLNHPHIITVHDIGESDAGRFIVMELVAGRTLRAVIAEDNTPQALLSLGAQMAKALSAAHAAGITHRDIKPDNIMVRDDGYVKVLDFGLARLVPTGLGEEDATIAQQTQPGQLMGTVKYMSPEQARGESVSYASDIFSLGLIFYELATGQHPFTAPSLVGLLNAIIADTPSAPTQLNPQLSPALERLILQMLHKDARQRPTAAEVDVALTEIGRGGAKGIGSKGEEPTLILSPSPALPVSPSSSRHTVGREPERNELREVFNKAKTGRGSLLCVAGEPGIGKTTLVEDWLTELAAQQSCTIARGRCSERLAGTEAYLPLLEALESLLAAEVEQVSNLLHREKMKQIAPTWYAQVVSLSGDSAESARLLAEVKAASQERMKRELANFLQAVAQQQPLVLFFDDLHWADISTIDLLSFLAGKFDALRVLIIVTYRPSDMLLSKHPFLQIKPDLQARGVCRELLLEFLNAAEIAEYLALEFPGHRFPPEFPQLIHAKTEGSPLFMADLVRYLRDHNVIAQTSGAQSGAWTLAQALPDIERELPESVRGMIERKIAQLEPEDHKLLTAASVQGYEFDSAIVAQVLSLDADEIEERLEKLERVFAFVKLVREEEFPNGTLTLKYRFVHVLYQNAFYALLRLTRKAALSASVAHALLNCYGEQDSAVASELAHLLEVARDFRRATKYYLLAAKNATQLFAEQAAVVLARRGLNLVSTLPESPEHNRLELNLQIILGTALMVTKGQQEPDVERAHLRACELGQQLGETQQLYQALWGLWYLRLVKGEIQTARESGEQLFVLAQNLRDPASLLLAHRVLGQTLFFLGEFTQARDHLAQGIALYDFQQHRSLAFLYGQDPGVACYLWAALTLDVLGYADQARQKGQSGLALANELAYPPTLLYLSTFISWLDYFRRENHVVLERAEMTVALAHERGGVLQELISTVWLGWALAKQGRKDLSLMHLSLTALQEKGSNIWLPYLYALLAETYGEAEQPEAGLRLLTDALAEMERTDQRQYEAELYRLKGKMLLQFPAPRQSEAEICFRQAIDVAIKQSAKSLELRAATSLARLWQQQGKREAAQQMLAEIYGWFTEGFDTADLQDAKALLDELHTQIASSLTATSDNSRHEFNLQVVAVEADTLKRELMTPDATAILKNEMPSIAVLPFVNISNDPDNEYFCDGLAEELLNALSKIEALHVAARTSSFSFKGKETDIREIGQKLNVGAVLEGSVRKAGNRLRITSQLINIADGYHLWSERYDRELRDIFDIQDEIALAIVEALKVKLLGAEKARVLKHYTDNTEAYQLYLQGRYHFFKLTGEGFRKSIEYYQAALAIEPDYALALAGLGLTWGTSIVFGYLSPEEGRPEMQAAITRALEIDDALAEVHYTLAMAKCQNGWEWQAAEQGFRRALELSPGSATARAQYGLLLASLSRTEEALAQGRRALELDPLSLVINLDVGMIFWSLEQYDRTQEQGRKLIELEPNFFGGHVVLGLIAWHEGNYEQAIAEMQQAVALGFPWGRSLAGCLYGITGQRDKAQQVLDELLQAGATKEGSSFWVAVVYAGIGELDHTFAWLERAYEQREAIHFKPICPLLPGVCADPRFAELLRRVGLPGGTQL